MTVVLSNLADALVDPGVAAALMILASIYIFIELYELVLIQQVVAVSTPEALCYYFAGIENVLQLLFTAGAILVTSVGFWSESRLDNWTYWVAAVSPSKFRFRLVKPIASY